MARILVIGGASGIGAASVDRFIERGDDVVVADIAALSPTRAESRDDEGDRYFLRCDLADPSSASSVVTDAAELLGGLDHVFISAGVLVSLPLDEWTAAAWDHSFAVNLRGPFLVAQSASRVLDRSTHPSILFNASTGAFRGHAGMPAYHASKAGLVNLAKALADELSPSGIRVNAICPGWVDTPFNDPYWSFQPDPSAARAELDASLPLRRQAVPADIADVVAFLCSSSARYITGTSVVVDGGYLAV